MRLYITYIIGIYILLHSEATDDQSWEIDYPVKKQVNNILEIVDNDQIETELTNARDNQLVLLVIFSNSCPSCALMEPQMDKFATDNPDLIILKVNMDKLEDVASNYDIHTSPGFVLFRNNQILETFIVAKVSQVKEKVREYQ